MHAVALDSKYLLNLAREKSAEGRKTLARVMADLFEGQLDELSESERSLMYDIIHTVVHDFEMPIRRAMAKRLAEKDDPPVELIRTLARDDIEVAYPILHQSRLLKNVDLVEIIHQRSLEHRLAIAGRAEVAEEVSDALVETSQGQVIETLLANTSARISHKTMEYLVEQSQRISAYQEPLLRRKDLPKDMAKRMFLWVSAALRQYVMENFELDQGAIDEMLEEISLIEIRSNETADRVPRRTRDLAEDMLGQGLITEDLLINALQSGEVALFVSMFAQLTDLREVLVKRVLFEPGGEGLAITCKAMGFGKGIFSALFSLSRRARRETDGMDANELPAVMDFYDQIPEQAAREVVANWQRGSDYLSAIRELDLAAKRSSGAGGIDPDAPLIV